MLAIRNASRSTFVASAIILFCVIYWISKSSTSYSPGFEESGLDSTSIYNHRQYGQQRENAAAPDLDNLVETFTTTEYSHDDNLEAGPEDDEESFSPKGPGLTQQTYGKQGDNQYPAQFPRLIWQTSSEEGRVKWASKSETWKKVKAYEYNYLTDDDATEFVYANFNTTQPSVVRFWDSLATPVLKADFLRYLVMLAKGGIYADIDTSVLKHPDTWIPISLGAQEINAIISIEYDDSSYPVFVRPISFCQWTLMSKPGHPIFKTAVQRVMSNMEFMARRQHKTVSDMVLEKADVMGGTGPGMITDVVMQVIRDQGYDVEWETFHEQKEAKLFGDVLILPINGFAGTQKHSHAGNPEYGEKFVAHHFGKSWYKGQHDPIGGATKTKSGKEKAKVEEQDDIEEESLRKDLANEGDAAKDLVKEEVAEDEKVEEAPTKKTMAQEGMNQEESVKEEVDQDAEREADQEEKEKES